MGVARAAAKAEGLEEGSVEVSEVAVGWELLRAAEEGAGRKAQSAEATMVAATVEARVQDLEADPVAGAAVAAGSARVVAAVGWASFVQEEAG